MIRALWVALLASAGPGSAAAEEFVGAWSFESVNPRKGCVINGRMVVRPPVDGVYACSFISTESCEGDPNLSGVQVDQSCGAVETETGFEIRSDVVQVLTPGYPAQWYNPDHFNVSPDGPGRMLGEWWDVNWSAAVRFWRDDDLPVS